MKRLGYSEIPSRPFAEYLDRKRTLKILYPCGKPITNLYCIDLKKEADTMKSLFLTFFLSLTCLVVQAQNESIYYKLVHPETKEESFVLGTYHHYPEGWYEVPSEVKEAIAKTTSLITETGTARSSKYSRKINQIIRYKQGHTVLDKL